MEITVYAVCPGGRIGRLAWARGVNNEFDEWIISGVLGTSLALAPALVASAQQASQQTPTPGQQGDWGQAGTAARCAKWTDSPAR